MTDNPYAERLRDAILSNSAIRDGLTDEEAQPIIDWGMEQADLVTVHLLDLPKADADAAYDEMRGTLPRLMTRITWIAIYRERKGYNWTRKTLDLINKLSLELHGEDGPTIPEPQLELIANNADGMATGPLLAALISHLTPPPTTSANPTNPTSTKTTEEVENSQLPPPWTDTGDMLA